jgi:adenine-specific DNA methylase
MTKRLIEEWLPIAEIGEESMRERRSMTALPPIYYLHVWWARRPLVASRAAVLASLLPADADRATFKHMLGIHGDPVASRKRIDAAKREGERFDGEAYTYKRAFTYHPNEKEEFWLLEETQKLGIEKPSVLDPTSGGGAIPFEALRLGCNTYANDINPVAVLVQKATYEWPSAFGPAVIAEFRRLADEFVRRREERLSSYYPLEPSPDCISTNYLWARTIHCPYCAGKVPLSPNWKLAPDGTGVRVLPQLGTGPGDGSRHCRFEIVASAKEQSENTVKGGDATCPYPDCGRVIDGDQVKAQAQAGGMGEQLFAVVFKKQVITGYTKSTNKKTSSAKIKWERGYRAPQPEDNNGAAIDAALSEKLPEWEALDLVPNEAIDGPVNYERGHIMYGMNKWRDFFAPRQLLLLGTCVEAFRELAQESADGAGVTSEVTRASLGYVALSIDTLVNYNSRSCRWDSTILRVRSVFDKHALALLLPMLRWPLSLMALAATGLLTRTFAA